MEVYDSNVGELDLISALVAQNLTGNISTKTDIKA